MALAIDSQETSAAGHHSTASPLTWSFTNTAGTLLIVGVVVTVQNTPGSALTVSAVSYGGDALTKIGSIGWGGSPTDNEVSLWYRLNPKTGANTVSVTSNIGGNTAPDAIAGAISFTGNDGTTPVGTPASAKNDTTGSTSASVTVASTTSGNYVVAGVGTGTGYSSTSNTRSWSLNNSSNTAGDNAALTDQSVSGTSTTMTDTVSNDWWGIIAVEVKAAAGGGTTPSGSDSATLTDTANQISVNGPSDSGSETEANKIGTGSSDAASVAEQNAIALLTSDSAAFAEQVAIASATSTSDTASVAESVKIALGATDSAQLGEAMALALAHQDSATLQELVSVALAIADAASLTESASVTQNGGNTPSASDSASLTDTATSTAHTSASDIGTLAEQAAIALKVTDVASMTEQIGLGLIAADSAALVEQLAIAVANAATDSAALAEVQTAVSAALAAAEAVHLGESATVQVFSGGARDWVYVISAPSAKWTAQAPTGKWTTAAPAVKWSASAPQQ